MADKELRKMNRTELIEIIYAMQQNERTLREENEKLQRLLHDKMIRLGRSGSIAEAALDLNHIFEDAEAAAQQYLDSLKDADERASQILTDAREKADEILMAAGIQRRQAECECEAMRDKAVRDIQRQVDAFTKSVNHMIEKYPELSAWMQEETEQQ